jgi:hypothetical protein
MFSTEAAGPGTFPAASANLVVAWRLASRPHMLLCSYPISQAFPPSSPSVRPRAPTRDRSRPGVAPPAPCARARGPSGAPRCETSGGSHHVCRDRRRRNQPHPLLAAGRGGPAGRLLCGAPGWTRVQTPRRRQRIPCASPAKPAQLFLRSRVRTLPPKRSGGRLAIRGYRSRRGHPHSAESDQRHPRPCGRPRVSRSPPPREAARGDRRRVADQSPAPHTRRCQRCPRDTRLPRL